MRKLVGRVALLILMLAPAALVVVVTVEAIRTGRFALGSGSAADDIHPRDSFLTEGVLDNAGWVIAACIAWIVVVALLTGLAALRASGQNRTR